MDTSITHHKEKSPSLSVNYEWGRLKEVVVGAPFLKVGTSLQSSSGDTLLRELMNLPWNNQAEPR